MWLGSGLKNTWLSLYEAPMSVGKRPRIHHGTKSGTSTQGKKGRFVDMGEGTGKFSTARAIEKTFGSSTNEQEEG